MLIAYTLSGITITKINFMLGVFANTKSLAKEFLEILTVGMRVGIRVGIRAGVTVGMQANVRVKVMVLK